jgi:toxin CcdB
MAQFDVHHNLDARSRKTFPYLLDVQTGLLDVLATRVVVPLALASATGKPAERLNPVFVIEEQEVVMSTPELAGIPARALGEIVTSLAGRRTDIIAALDFLLTGV